MTSIIFIIISCVLGFLCIAGWWNDNTSKTHRQEVYAWIGIFIALAFYFRS